MAREDELTSATSFPGINNLDPEASLTLGSLREAVNVDLVGNPERGIKPRLRPGRTEFVADVGAHSLWCDRDMPFALYASGAGALRALFPDASTEDVVPGLAEGKPVSYALVNDTIFWSNAVQSGLITLGLETRPWAVEGPPATPVCAPDAAGGLDAGTYQLACTFIDRHGRESGTGLAQSTEVEAGGGILLTDIPQPADPVEVPTIRVYLTGAGDDVLRRHQDLPAGTTTFLVGKAPRGAPLQTQLLFLMPPGHIVRTLNGQMLVARGREMLISPGLRYGMVDPARGRIGFPKRLDLMEPIEGEGAGVFVASANRTWFVSGANLMLTDQVRQRIVVHHGAVPGTACRVEGALLGLEVDQPVPVWLNTAGQFCAGLPGGTIVRFNLDSAVTDLAESGAMLFRESNGHRQLVAALSGATRHGLAVQDKVTVREYRHDEEPAP